jgi:dTDP-4-dehydrorhamnose 3,5-epimerase
MAFHETGIAGLKVYEPRLFEDNRGYFFEAYNRESFEKGGVAHSFVQDNQSRSSFGVIRGLHYQLNPNAQTKLVRAIAGRILDVAVDLRNGSPTFGKVFSIELSGQNFRQLLIPAGFAHGFSVLSEEAIVLYKCDALYHKQSEQGIRFNDPGLKIDWQIPAGKEQVSEKDEQLPAFHEAIYNFTFNE